MDAPRPRQDAFAGRVTSEEDLRVAGLARRVGAAQSAAGPSPALIVHGLDAPDVADRAVEVDQG